MTCFHTYYILSILQLLILLYLSIIHFITNFHFIAQIALTISYCVTYTWETICLKKAFRLSSRSSTLITVKLDFCV